MDCHQTTHIIIIVGDGSQRIVHPPEGFSWIPYSPVIEFEGRAYEYAHFCMDAVPRYKVIAV